MKWEEYFLSVATTIKEKSKDPSTKVGAVIAGPDNQLISAGFNGFPRGINEEILARWERPTKYDFIEHAERNAIYNAARHGIALRGCTLYLVGMGPPTIPCIECAKAIIQSGIARVVGYGYKPAPDQWAANFQIASDLLKEAGVEFQEISALM